MAWYAGKKWKRGELARAIGDPQQMAGARGSILTDGKADGVRAVEVSTGSGFNFTVLPGPRHGHSVCLVQGQGRSGFFSGTESPPPPTTRSRGCEWRRSLLRGAPHHLRDRQCRCSQRGPGQGRSVSTAGWPTRRRRISASTRNGKATSSSIRLKGTMREAEAMVENLTLTRRIETRLGSRDSASTTRWKTGVSRRSPSCSCTTAISVSPFWPAARVVGPITKSVPVTRRRARTGASRNA